MPVDADTILCMTNTIKHKILWVEDDSLLGKILSKEIINSGFDLTLAKNSGEALDAIKQNIPDVIMVDLLLPGGMDGFGILEQVQSDASLKDVPKVVLSNLSKPSDIEKAKSLGANKFLIKADTSLDQIITELRNQCA